MPTLLVFASNFFFFWIQCFTGLYPVSDSRSVARVVTSRLRRKVLTCISQHSNLKFGEHTSRARLLRICPSVAGGSVQGQPKQVRPWSGASSGTSVVNVRTFLLCTSELLSRTAQPLSDGSCRRRRNQCPVYQCAPVTSV